MDDPADIAFVYPHPERDCCAHHMDTVVDEVFLCLIALLGAESGMIGGRPDAVF